MKEVFDFLSGELSPYEFKKIWYSNQNIRNWINNLIDLKTESPIRWIDIRGSMYRMAMYKQQVSVEEYIRNGDAFLEKNKRSFSKFETMGWNHEVIASVVIIAYPDAVITNKYLEARHYYYKVCSEYFGGEEVQTFIDDTLSAFWHEKGKVRITMAKKAIKDAFHLTNNKRPNWIQEPEWPMGKNSPMRFVSQSHNADLFKYVFEDVDTGEQRIVEQFA